MLGIAINGGRSTIARALVKQWLSRDEVVVQVQRGQDMPLDTHRYLFCQGLLFGKSADEMSSEQYAETMLVNFVWIAEQCNLILAANDHARICVLGSESGFASSYDAAYAEAKWRLHRYVETKPLRTPDQQLVCIAPSIIADSGMTLRRTDTANLAMRERTHPKQRFLQADEVAALVHHVLYIDRGYLSGVTIRMNGGAHNGTAQKK